MTNLREGLILNNRYRLVAYKGRGTFGEVWLAHDEMLGIEVAVKVYVSLDEAGIEEFKEEYRLACNLHHSNLWTVSYFDQWEGRPYLVMKYSPRGSAAHLAGNMPELQLWAFIRDVASGLAYLHSLQPEPIVHQDIKPDNILEDENGRFLITDFGISKKIRSTLRKQSGRASGAGAVAYMGPERFSKDPAPIKASDIWSLGVTIYELATGDLPFCGMGGGMLAQGAELPELDAPWSADLNMVMQACLAKEPWNRPMAAPLAQYAAAKAEGRPAVPTWKKPPQQQKEPHVKQEEPLRREGARPTTPQTPPASSDTPHPEKKRTGKKGGVILAAAIIVVVSLAFWAIMQKDPLTLEAEAALPDYRSEVLQCQTLIAQGDKANTEALLKAKDILSGLKEKEDKYAVAVPEYNRWGTLTNTLDPKLISASEAWATAARSQYQKLDNVEKASEYYQLALRLREDGLVRGEYQNMLRECAYMKIKDMEFRNEGDGSTVINDYGVKLKASEIKYLTPRISYNGLYDQDMSVTLKVRVYFPDGSIWRGKASPEGCSYTHEITVHPGSGNYAAVSGWGSADGGIYFAGKYRFEIWYSGNKLFTKYITLH